MPVRRMQDVHSMVSITPYAEEKEQVLFIYDAPMAFQIHFSLTIKQTKKVRACPFRTTLTHFVIRALSRETV